ncbi:MAG: DUF4442 domain-containing protein [Actinomycetota bacterium]|nr:DUF4442 domain-containing protein [Actinomycetota bacterium]
MKEPLKTKLTRWGFNLFPAYLATGARIIGMSDDLREVSLKLPLNWRTRNYVGTIFGGSMYAAVDPVYMIMLMKNLGPEYVVWDKAAKIHFKKPGRETLYARFALDAEEIAYIETMLDASSCVELEYLADLTDESGEVHASVEKTFYIRRKDQSGLEKEEVLALEQKV